MLDLFNNIFSEFHGCGHLHFQGGTPIPINFRLIQLHSGEIYLHTSFINGYDHRSKEAFDPRSIEKVDGELSDGSYFVSLEKPLCVESKLRISGDSRPDDGLYFLLGECKANSDDGEGETARYYVTNLLFTGTNGFIAEDEYHQKYLPIDINNKILKICPLPTYNHQEEILRKIKKPRITAYVEVPLCNATFEEANRIVSNLCSLASLARGTKINWISVKYFDSRRNVVFSYFRNAITWDYTGLPAVASSPNESEDRLALLNFLQSSFKPFERLKEQYRLHEIIDTLVAAKVGGFYLELRGLFVSSTIDTLCGRWADMNNEAAIFNDGDFQVIKPVLEDALSCIIKERLPNTGKEQRAKAKEKISEFNRTSFARRLKGLCAEYGVAVTNAEIKEFIRTRNNLVHSARLTDYKIKEGTRSYENEFWNLIAFADKLIMGMLSQGTTQPLWKKLLADNGDD